MQYLFSRPVARIPIETPSRFFLNGPTTTTHARGDVHSNVVSDVKTLLGIELFQVQFPSCHFLKQKGTTTDGINEILTSASANSKTQSRSQSLRTSLGACSTKTKVSGKDRFYYFANSRFIVLYCILDNQSGSPKNWSFPEPSFSSGMRRKKLAGSENEIEQDLIVKQKSNTSEGSNSAAKHENVVSKVPGLKKQARKRRSDS